MSFINILLHLDQYINLVVANYHGYFYALLFLVIFCETGLVITPFLPGDSLLFLAGALAGTGQLNFLLLAVTIFAAAFLGDNNNFFIGKYFGQWLFKNPKSKIFRQEYLIRTHAFYEKNGRKTLIIARFLPILRTFAPFVAGFGRMHYSRFIGFSLLGSLLWVVLFLGGGFLFGNITIIKNHLSLLILLVIILSVIPLLKMTYDELKQSSLKQAKNK